MKTEVEARLLECDVKKLITKLKENNAKFIGDWLQIRKCYDFKPVLPNSWIRLRTNGKTTTLTIKEIADKSITGTKECEIVVSDFNTTDEILNRLGYFARSHQENRRIQYVLDDVEVDIDLWPKIPPYVEFEAESEDAIKAVTSKLGIEFDKLTTCDCDEIYKSYGIILSDYPILPLEDEKKREI